MENADIQTVAVIGAGTMGRGIAQVVAVAGFQARLFDASETALAEAVEGIQAGVQKLAEKGRISGDSQTRVANGLLQPRRHLPEAVSGADLVIEAVPESPEIKTALFQELRGILQSGQPLVATNTSTFSISDLAEISGCPDRFFGLHFFNPPPLMKLVEVVRGGQTSDAVIDRATAFAKALGKTPVLAQRDTPGFIVNRINAASFALFQNLAERGGHKPETIDAAMRAFGWPMGPFELMDFIGLDVMVAMGACFARTLHPDYGPPAHLRRLVEQGMLGRKSGGGYHDWSKGRPQIDANAGSLRDFEPLDAILAQFNEAARLIEAGVCSEADADLAMTLGNGVVRGPVEIGRAIPPRERESQLIALAARHGLAMLRPGALSPTDGRADPRMKKRLK